MTREFYVAHRPEEANPKELPWRVSRYEAPIRWFRFETYARFYCDAMNRGLCDEDAMQVVRDAPEWDDVRQTALMIQDEHPEADWSICVQSAAMKHGVVEREALTELGDKE